MPLFLQRRTQILFDSGLITFLQLLIRILIRSYSQSAIGAGSRGRCRLGLADLSWQFWQCVIVCVFACVCVCVCVFSLPFSPFFLSILFFFLISTPLQESIWYLCSPSERGPMEFPGLINEQTLTDGQRLTCLSLCTTLPQEALYWKGK